MPMIIRGTKVRSTEYPQFGIGTVIRPLNQVRVVVKFDGHPEIESLTDYLVPVANIEFTGEGGFRFNGQGRNPYVEPPEKIVHSFVKMSRLAATYGMTANEGDPIGDSIAWAINRPAGFGRIDTGSLLRIAVASEEMAREMKALRKEMKEMMKFWKELRDKYRKQKEPIDKTDD